MKYLFLLSVLILSACVNAPKIISGKGSVYGVLSADSHSAFNKKMNDNQDITSIYGEMQTTGIKYQSDMVDYAKLDELYVGLIQASLPPQQHQITATTKGMSRKSIALATGDTLLIRNNTNQIQNFFIAETSVTGENIQTFPGLATGASASYKVELEGDLELLSEDNEALKTVLFSKKNMLTKRVNSGDSFQFENLAPGSYQLIFWYWRLGKIQQTIQVKSDENTRVDKILTVDNVINAYLN
ncbi:MAG: hypothetical protein ISR72_12730 [Methylobacter sp.]|nr:hypothetical protein [Methylobacter sp.]